MSASGSHRRRQYRRPCRLPYRFFSVSPMYLLRTAPMSMRYNATSNLRAKNCVRPRSCRCHWGRHQPKPASSPVVRTNTLRQEYRRAAPRFTPHEQADVIANHYYSVRSRLIREEIEASIVDAPAKACANAEWSNQRLDPATKGKDYPIDRQRRRRMAKIRSEPRPVSD